MSELNNWLEFREKLRTETRGIKEMLDSPKVFLEENNVDNELSTFLKKAQGNEEMLMKEVKTVVLQDNAKYDKDTIVGELKKLLIAAKGSDEELLQGITNLLPEKSDSYNKDEIEMKLNEMLATRHEENQNIYNNIKKWCVESSDYLRKYKILNQQVSVLCDNVDKYMDLKDKAIAVLEERVLCIIEKSNYSKKQMQNKAVEMNSKHNARLNWNIAMYVVLILLGFVAQVVLFLKSGINEATKDAPVFWARSVWFLIAILIILGTQILLIISLKRTGKKKSFVRNNLEKLIIDISLRKVSHEEFDRIMGNVTSELEK